MKSSNHLSVTPELGRLFPSISSIRGGGRRGESSELLSLGLVLGNHLICFSMQLIQIILVLHHGQSQNGQLKKYGDQMQHQRNHGCLAMPHKTTSGKTPSKFASELANVIFFSCVVKTSE